MENAIRRAIEGGYDNDKFTEPWIDELYLCDPLFWQALCKSLGYNKKGYPRVKYKPWWPEWKYQMHRFIDHLASGGDIDSFFNSLLAKKE